MPEREVPEINDFPILPALGVDRLTLCLLLDAYEEEELEGGETRVVLKLNKQLAPVQVAFFPLSKKLAEPAQQVFQSVASDFACEYDESQSIGKRYRRQDEIGTPLCVTVDFDTENDKSVTVRDRDTMQQERIAIDQLKDYLSSKLA